MSFTLNVYEENILNKIKSNNKGWQELHNIAEDYQWLIKSYNISLVRTYQLRKEISEMNEELCEIRKQKNDFEKLFNQNEAINNQNVEKYKSLICSLTSENKCISDECSDYKKKLDATYNEIGNLSKKIDEYKECILHKESAISVTLSELKASQDLANDIQKENESLKLQNNIIIEQIKTEKMKLIEKYQEVTELQQEVEQKFDNICYKEKQLELEKEIHQSRTFFWQSRNHPYVKKLQKISSFINEKNTEKAILALKSILSEIEKDENESSNLPDQETYIMVDSDNDSKKTVNNANNLPKSSSLSNFCHSSSCTGCVFDSYGHNLITSSLSKSNEENTVVAWDVENKCFRKSLCKSGKSIMSVAISSNDVLALGGGSDKCVHVWNIRNGVQSAVMTGHTKGINCVACDVLDGNRAVSSGEDKRILHWDLISGYQFGNSSIHPDEGVNTVCYTYDKNIIVSGHSKGSIYFWDVRVSKAVNKKFQTHDDLVVSLCSFSYSNHLIATAGRDNKMKIYDIRNEKIIKSFEDRDFFIGTIGYMGRGHCVIAVSPDEEYLAAGSLNGKIHIWNLKEHHFEPIILYTEFHNDSIIACGWNKSWQFVSCDKSGSVVFWRSV